MQIVPPKHVEKSERAYERYNGKEGKCVERLDENFDRDFKLFLTIVVSCLGCPNQNSHPLKK